MSSLHKERQQKDHFFRRSGQSPIPAEQRAAFSGLAYYEENEALALEVTVEPFAKKTEVQIQTTTGETRWYRRYGQFSFTVDGQEARLTIYQTPNGFFLPFVDAGAGTETYPAGRYLDPEPLGGNRFRVNFNLAYNPYCAYSDNWSCPITPAENYLSVSIRAGEKLP